MNPSDGLTTAEVAFRLKITPRGVRKMLSKAVRNWKHNNQLRWCPKSLEAYISRRNESR